MTIHQAQAQLPTTVRFDVAPKHPPAEQKVTKVYFCFLFFIRRKSHPVLGGIAPMNEYMRL